MAFPVPDAGGPNPRQHFYTMVAVTLGSIYQFATAGKRYFDVARQQINRQETDHAAQQAAAKAAKVASQTAMNIIKRFVFKHEAPKTGKEYALYIPAKGIGLFWDTAQAPVQVLRGILSLDKGKVAANAVYTAIHSIAVRGLWNTYVAPQLPVEVSTKVRSTVCPNIPYFTELYCQEVSTPLKYATHQAWEKTCTFVGSSGAAILNAGANKASGETKAMIREMVGMLGGTINSGLNFFSGFFTSSNQNTPTPNNPSAGPTGPMGTTGFKMPGVTPEQRKPYRPHNEFPPVTPPNAQETPQPSTGPTAPDVDPTAQPQADQAEQQAFSEEVKQQVHEQAQQAYESPTPDFDFPFFEAKETSGFQAPNSQPHENIQGASSSANIGGTASTEGAEQLPTGEGSDLIALAIIAAGSAITYFGATKIAQMIHEYRQPPKAPQEIDEIPLERV